MKLPRPFGALLLAVLLTSPAWANYGWGQMGMFRPGIQLSIVLLALITEITIIRLITRMSWGWAAIATVTANAVSGLLGSVFVGQARLTEPELFVLIIPSLIIEAPIIISFAASQSPRLQPRHWAFIAAIPANVLSAGVCFGYLWLNYRGEEQPIIGREGWAMHLAASTLRERYWGSIIGDPEEGLRPRHIFRRLGDAQDEVSLDVAPPWLPWAQFRPARLYESGHIPRTLAPKGQGAPMVWTGGPYLQGRRGVLFSDGEVEFMTEREFRKLDAMPQPLPQWLVEHIKKPPPTLSPPGEIPRPSPRAPAAGSSPNRAAPGGSPRSPKSAPPPP